MSVRAYRVNEIKYEEDSTFNLWFDEDLVYALEDMGYLNTSVYDGGFVEVPIKALEEILREVNLSPETKEAIKKDIEYAKKKKNNHVLYYCF